MLSVLQVHTFYTYVMQSTRGQINYPIKCKAVLYYCNVLDMMLQAKVYLYTHTAFCII